ncbi:unnamed protein product [Acanthoscelides obtectus]|uniref:C-type lectin domain-containing protein n=1 Tax=Acanthoscelides obtectus TaxID=200917 RepID=A0A9P0PTR8_ACAOB|nr:unnamed protein product [Acanthoscelides obtectus]CAK1667134.1 Pulmonary surfactant-associated protein D [Acanthoscelides obtectus]
MDSKSCVVVIALVAVSSGLQLQTFHNTTVVIEAVQSSEVVLFWTSGRRHDNFWRWDSTGRPIHYTNWEKGEPNNSGGTENCLQLRFNTISKTLQWNDCACDASSYFICESRD